MTPNDIEILIHCHVSPTKHPRADAPGVIESLNMLEKCSMIEQDRHGIYSTTTRGAAHLRQLCETRFPEQAWVDTQGRVIAAQRKGKGLCASRNFNEGVNMEQPKTGNDPAGAQSRLTVWLGAWMPIETAPKDGTPLLVFDGYAITTAAWEVDYDWWEICVPSDGYVDSNCIEPTHWMSLPEAPNP